MKPLQSDRFSPTEIALAIKLHPLWGERWQPAPGHYVLDLDSQISKPSPFQDRVYFVLNYDYFMELVGGWDAFKRSMAWLPSWEQAREVASELGISADDIVKTPAFLSALADRREREVLYDLLYQRLHV